MHWRAVTKDNVTSIYGRNPNRRIADPADASRVFKWLLEATFDDKGNVILYKYKVEDATGIDLAAANERNRQSGISRLSLRARWTGVFPAGLKGGTPCSQYVRINHTALRPRIWTPERRATAEISRDLSALFR
jgi:hypothetical protein